MIAFKPKGLRPVAPFPAATVAPMGAKAAPKLPKAPASPKASGLHSRGHFEAQAKAHLTGAIDSHDGFTKL